MDKTLGISVVLGAALGKGYFKTFESVKQKTARLGREWAKTNKKLAATGAVIKYKNLLDQLRAKQATLGTSSKRLQDGINQVERRYKEAKPAAKGYGIQIGQVTAEHGRLQAALRRTQQQTIAHTRAIPEHKTRPAAWALCGAACWVCWAQLTAPAVSRSPPCRAKNRACICVL